MLIELSKIGLNIRPVNLLLVLSFILPQTSFAEPRNIVPQGKSVQLISSEELAQNTLSDQDLRKWIKQRAQGLCSSLSQSLARYERVVFSETEVGELQSLRTYSTSVAAPTGDGLVFEDGVFQLHQVPIPMSRDELLRNKQTCCLGGSGVALLVGGFMSMMMYMGFEGPGDAQAGLASICATAAISGAMAVAGGIVKVYRACTQEPAGDIEDQRSHPAPLFRPYVLPILAREVWCEN